VYFFYRIEIGTGQIFGKLSEEIYVEHICNHCLRWKACTHSEIE